MSDIERLGERMDRLEKKMEELEGQIGSNKVKFRRLADDFNDMRYELNELDNKVENVSRRPPEDG